MVVRGIPFLRLYNMKGGREMVNQDCCKHGHTINYGKWDE
jgi:hypothetical protein